MELIVVCICAIIICVLMFVMGSRWRAIVIRAELNEMGFSICRYGERKNDFIKIIGKCEDFQKSV